MSVCGYIHASMDILAPRGQKRALYHLELEFQEVVSHPVWVLGTQIEFSARALHTPNCCYLSSLLGGFLDLLSRMFY